MCRWIHSSCLRDSILHGTKLFGQLIAPCQSVQFTHSLSAKYVLGVVLSASTFTHLIKTSHCFLSAGITPAPGNNSINTHYKSYFCSYSRLD